MKARLLLVPAVALLLAGCGGNVIHVHTGAINGACRFYGALMVEVADESGNIVGSQQITGADNDQGRCVYTGDVQVGDAAFYTVDLSAGSGGIQVVTGRYILSAAQVKAGVSVPR